METRIKRPPINIKELRREEEIPQKGSLSYAGGGSTSEREPSKVNYTQIFVSVILSALLAFVLMTTMSSSKKDSQTLLDNQKALEGRIAAIDSKIASEVNRINNIINSMGEYAKRSELSGYASKSEIPAKPDLSPYSTVSALNEANKELAALKVQISTLEVKIATTNTTQVDIDSLKSRIATLEATVALLRTQLGSLSIKVYSFIPSSISPTSTEASQLTVIISNSGAATATVRLVLTLTTSPSISVGSASMDGVAAATLSGTTIIFYKDVTVMGGGSATLNPQVRIAYTGTATATWTVAWTIG